MLESLPKARPSDVMLVTSTAGVVSPEASWVRPSVLPTVPRLRLMVESAAPSVQPETEMVAGLGEVEASEPSLLKVIATEPEVVPVEVEESEDSVGLPNDALQLLAAVLVQVTWIEFAVPSES